MAVELTKLRRAIDLALDLVESEEGPSIELEQDYYWEIDKLALYDPYTEPNAHDLGQLSHDWERIKEIAEGRMPAVGATLSWAGALMRALAHRARY